MKSWLWIVALGLAAVAFVYLHNRAMGATLFTAWLAPVVPPPGPLG